MNTGDVRKWREGGWGGEGGGEGGRVGWGRDPGVGRQAGRERGMGWVRWRHAVCCISFNVLIL